jgi:phosphohistidine phosphatase
MTARFYLVRHAEAERSASHGGDAARRLTPEGRSRFVAHARALAGELAVARIVASPFVRARETADLLRAATGAPVTPDDALASGASSGRALLLLGRAYGAGTALVGHNPELAEAIARAAGRDVRVDPGTIAAIDDDGRHFTLAFVRPIERPGPT